MMQTSTTSVLGARLTPTQNNTVLRTVLRETYKQIRSEYGFNGEQHELRMPQQTRVQAQRDRPRRLVDGQSKTGLIQERRRLSG